ncbi:Ribonuclease [Scale drop disease virus]|uniref:Transactivator/viroplasmin protein n=1 Tax=Scale drop disease virus TaxID=1697349 RepID=A0A0K1L784_9VIRU|nr:Rnase H [Scale drop disease virus]AKU37500.1 ORF_085L [Scale drop disease virus]QLI60759.1 Ribonuclease [Scale drop disease virus]QXJ13677.1 ORF085L [Scale drop disease virus]UNH60696.1 Ribonuclease [Scale drop disease virus]
MVKGKYYYAVRKGFKTGVYKSWDECKSQVDKFPAAVFKKFATEQDAWAFVREGNVTLLPEKKVIARVEQVDVVLPKQGPKPLYYVPLGKKMSLSESKAAESPKQSKTSDGFTYMGDAVVVYTDGCCLSNGQKQARAGIGVYWGYNHPLNVAERLVGQQTNQRAEIQAASKALQQAQENKIKKLVVYTDSMFTINGVTKWVKNWKQNGWRLHGGGSVVNKDDFMKLDQLNLELEVVWLHIPGHAGYKGNEEADRLAREGATKPYIKENEDTQQ